MATTRSSVTTAGVARSTAKTWRCNGNSELLGGVPAFPTPLEYGPASADPSPGPECRESGASVQGGVLRVIRGEGKASLLSRDLRLLIVALGESSLPYEEKERLTRLLVEVGL